MGEFREGEALSSGPPEADGGDLQEQLRAGGREESTLRVLSRPPSERLYPEVSELTGRCTTVVSLIANSDRMCARISGIPVIAVRFKGAKPLESPPEADG